jgi:ribosomal-protein-alanine N-acetyltransferase
MGYQFKTWLPGFVPDINEKQSIIDFLYVHLGIYGDKKEYIEKAIDYALGLHSAIGGFVMVATSKEEVVGVSVINKTGMQNYIPENILVYLAVHDRMRGKGLGKEMMQRVINQTEGDIALHVEKDNPARSLYEKLGFQTPYLEMRLRK